jgi:hypothetical protein
MADAKPGDGNAKNLHQYWVYGAGRAKWNTWAELYHHLRKFMIDEMAKRTAANRKAPRGERVGPG